MEKTRPELTEAKARSTVEAGVRLPKVLKGELIRTEHKKKTVSVIVEVLASFTPQKICEVNSISKQMWANFIIDEAEKLGLIKRSA